jgi:hypothetical protein
VIGYVRVATLTYQSHYNGVGSDINWATVDVDGDGQILVWIAQNHRDRSRSAMSKQQASELADALTRAAGIRDKVVEAYDGAETSIANVESELEERLIDLVSGANWGAGS